MDEILNEYLPTEEMMDKLIEDFSSELSFCRKRVEQGADVYQYLLSVTPNEDVLTSLVILLAYTYAGTEHHESMELTIANRFDFQLEDFLDD